ncbi:MAG: amidohydrolase family protein [Rhizobiales bacterium]|nr:amidohydrolase family protein [Hyphomicrobiales bacterium]
MIIDAHVHLWRLRRGDNLALTPDMAPIYRDREPDDLRPLLDAAGIDRIIVIQAAWTLAETLFTVGLSARYPWIAGIVGWIDPASPSLTEEIAALALTGKVKGFRPVSTDDNRSIAWMLDARFERCWDEMKRAGMVLEFLLQNPDEVPLVTHFARRHPDMAIILDHCAKPDIAGGRFQPWAGDIGELAKSPNVMCKLSGLLNCARPGAGAAELKPYADHVIAAFGPQRLIWASDWPPLELAADYATWRRVSLDLIAGLGGDERAAILGGNAARIYGIA